MHGQTAIDVVVVIYTFFSDAATGQTHDKFQFIMTQPQNVEQIIKSRNCQNLSLSRTGKAAIQNKHNPIKYIPIPMTFACQRTSGSATNC